MDDDHREEKMVNDLLTHVEYNYMLEQHAGDTPSTCFSLSVNVVNICKMVRFSRSVRLPCGWYGVLEWPTLDNCCNVSVYS